MFKIGEFSKLTQVSVRMLRYYDETGLLKPARVDPDTNYRLYSVDQIPELHKILFLRDTGFNVSEIADALAHWDDACIAARLNAKAREIRSAIESEREKLAKIAAALGDLQTEKITLHCNVTLKSIPAYQVISRRRVIPDYFSEGQLWEELAGFIRNELPDISENTGGFAIYHDSECREADVDVEVCVVVDRPGESRNGFTFRVTEAVATMACAMVYGPFENIAAAYTSVARWLSEHDRYRMTGQSRQICHRGPWNEADPERYLTEIQIPVERMMPEGG